MPSDEELMAAWIGGDARAFDGLFARYAPVLLRVLGRRCKNDELARDLTQQTFLQLHRSRHDFRADARLRPWLFTIALNLLREQARRTRRRPEAPLDLDGLGDPAEAPRGVERYEARRDVQLALGSIGADQREVIELHWFDGLSFAEVADLLGTSEGAVKVRAHRGYVALRRFLGNPSLASGIPDASKGRS